ncbi:hypothetical protein [Burkholderia dolosa]|uniref:hypothetical protein n=1 Tax=Burkholderia dolosa TaxID=152500 RepID=UPI001590EB9F|nr:hypothetical protein [Burkholderia dolosa]MBY4752760.1 hypothetical protein [Burkholderia dolosa]
MQKDDALARIREDLGTQPSLVHACEAIVEYVAARPATLLERVTFGSLSKAASLSDVKEVIPAVQYLSGSRLPLFETAYSFIDGDEEYDLSDEDIQEARRTRVFNHPDLGEPVRDFERLIYVYFRLTPEAVELCADGK